MDYAKKVEAAGWTVECESPLELRHEDGSFATGQAAFLVIASEMNANGCREALEDVSTAQNYGIWFKGDPSQGKEAGWLRDSNHVALWSEEQARNFVKILQKSTGGVELYVVRPVYLKTDPLN